MFNTRFFTFSLLIGFFITGCGYQNKNLPPLDRKSDSIIPNTPNNDGSDISDNDEGNEGQEKSTDTVNLNKLLSIYLKNFIKTVKVQKNGQPLLVDSENIPDDYQFDTRVDYQGMYSLLNTGNKNYINLTSAIRFEFKTLKLDFLNDSEKLAFYINAYNFFAMDVIVRNYKKSNGVAITSIKDIKGTLFNPFAIFSSNYIRLSGNANLISLDYIEKTLAFDIGKKLLGNKTDARLHFAIICASIGCPVIPNFPYSGSEINEQLDLVTEQGLKHKRMFSVNKQTVTVSKIFDWYKNDFDNDPNGGQINFLKHHINSNDDFEKIDYISYNWNLNSIENLNIKYELPAIRVSQNTKKPCLDISKDPNFIVIASCTLVEKDEVGSGNTYKVPSASACLFKKKDQQENIISLEVSLGIQEDENQDEESELLEILLNGENISTNKKQLSFMSKDENSDGETITSSIIYNSTEQSLSIKMTKPWLVFGTTKVLHTKLKCTKR